MARPRKNSLKSTDTPASLPTETSSNSASGTEQHIPNQGGEQTEEGTATFSDDESTIVSSLAALSEAAQKQDPQEQQSTSAASSVTTISSSVSPAVPVSQLHAAHRRGSLSIAEIVNLAAANKSGQTRSGAANNAATTAAVEKLNLPESLRDGLLKADSSVLNALLPLIRQKLAAKTAEAMRRASVDGSVTSSPALSSTSRRSSTSARSEDHRNSHKLAERKRRKEMKDFFDALRDFLPPGARKSSKWEILIEAADEIDRLLATENELLRRREHLLKSIKQQQQQQQQPAQ